MKTIGLFEAKQKLSALVERANAGEQIGITRRGKLAAMIVPARNDAGLKEAFAAIERIRMRAKRLPKGMTFKDLIEEGINPPLISDTPNFSSSLRECWGAAGSPASIP